MAYKLMFSVMLAQNTCGVSPLVLYWSPSFENGNISDLDIFIIWKNEQMNEHFKI